MVLIPMSDFVECLYGRAVCNLDSTRWASAPCKSHFRFRGDGSTIGSRIGVRVGDWRTPNAFSVDRTVLNQPLIELAQEADMPAIRHFAIAALLIVSVPQLPAQGAPGFDGGVTETLQSIYIPPLVGAPFSAIVHTEWARPIPSGGSYTAVNQHRVARDGRGRIYEERWLLVPKDSGA
jgi:hypothetical protein